MYISITALDEKLRRLMEPRTASYKKQLEVIRKLSNSSVPSGVINVPIIPGINDHEVPKVLKTAADSRAIRAGYTIVRLNDEIGIIFKTATMDTGTRQPME